MTEPSPQDVERLRQLYLDTDLAAAVTLATRLTQAHPNHGFAWNVLGSALARQGRTEEAIAALRTAARLLASNAMVHSNLGAALLADGQLEAAEASLERALLMNPDLADACNNLAVAKKRAGRFDEAVAGFERAVRMRPEFADAWTNLGLALLDLGRAEAAEAALRRALQMRPALASTQVDLALALEALGRLEEADQCLGRALQADCRFARAWSARGILLGSIGHLREARACLQQAIALDADFLPAHSALLFGLAYEVELGDEFRKAADRFGDLVTRCAQGRFQHWPCDQAQDGCLRVGFVSGDLHDHTVAYFLESWLPKLDRKRLQITAYPTNRVEDQVTARLRSWFAAWKPIAGLDDRTAARVIHDDGIQILVDLSGHTAHNRLALFGWKPAPLQVTWLGFFATTGVEQIDFVLADPFSLPRERASDFRERVWYLPRTRLCFSPPPYEIEISPLPSLQGAPFTFGAFHALGKIHDGVIEVWAKILHAVPASRLYIKSRQLQSASEQSRLAARFAAHGLPMPRLLLEGPSPRPEYLRAYHRVDVALDPFPYTGGTTTAESLWMGVPVLTLAGRSMLARQGVSLLENLGMREWIAPDASSYVERALQGARDPAALATLRRSLRARALASPVFDAAAFAEDLAQALQQMWKSRSAQR